MRQAQLGRRVQNDPATLRLHHRDRLPAPKVDTLYIHIEQPVEAGLVYVQYGAYDAYPSVVEKDVQTAIGFDRGPHRQSHRRRVGNVGMDRTRDALPGSDQFRGLIVFFPLHVDDHDLGSLAGKLECGSPSDP